METTFQPSLPSFLTKITAIEAIELSILGFAIWCLGISTAIKEPGVSVSDQIPLLIGLELIILGSWAIYNAFIRIARVLPPRTDLRLRLLTVGLTGTYTFWAWIILDVNRLLVSKLFYRGQAPVEYAWSARSKQIRKVWEQEQKSASA
jgi:hypothetical protein